MSLLEKLESWLSGKEVKSMHCFWEDPSSNPGTHLVGLITVGNSSSMGTQQL